MIRCLGLYPYFNACRDFCGCNDVTDVDALDEQFFEQFSIDLIIDLFELMRF